MANFERLDIADRQKIRLIKNKEMKKITKETFWLATTATWEPCATPNETPAEESRHGSTYWFYDDHVVRRSDHWGFGIAACDWHLRGMPELEARDCRLPETTAKCYFSDFTEKAPGFVESLEASFVFRYSKKGSPFGGVLVESHYFGSFSFSDDKHLRHIPRDMQKVGVFEKRKTQLTEAMIAESWRYLAHVYRIRRLHEKEAEEEAAAMAALETKLKSLKEMTLNGQSVYDLCQNATASLWDEFSYETNNAYLKSVFEEAFPLETNIHVAGGDNNFLAFLPKKGICFKVIWPNVHEGRLKMDAFVDIQISLIK